MKWNFEKETMTIRSIPENYWIASFNSWDTALDHERNGKIAAAAPELLEAIKGLAKSALILAEDKELDAGAPVYAFIEDAYDIINRLEKQDEN